MRRYLTVFHVCWIFFSSLAADAAETRKKELTLYTAVTATTPQIPLQAAVREGWPEGYSLKTEYWKNLDDLRGIMLAGKGDIWIGHLEGFAQAAKRGAPVTLIAVTGWKKFYFVASSDLRLPESASSPVVGLAEALRQTGQALAVAPQDSPALGILEAAAQLGGPSFSIAAMPPQQLMLEMLRGARSCALLPEPLLSGLLAKKSGLRVVASLEEEAARLFGGPNRLPWVGIAVHSRLIEENPRLVADLVERMQRAATRLADDPEAGAAVLPSEVARAVGGDVLAASMERDLVMVVPAARARDEIVRFLRMVAPTALVPGTGESPAPPAGFFPREIQ
jgi:NitT/TauT family transport system substrate-binding protein